MIIHEIKQLMYVNTIWVVANEKDGAIRHYDSNQVTLSKNCTIELNLEDK